MLLQNQQRNCTASNSWSTQHLTLFEETAMRKLIPLLVVAFLAVAATMKMPAPEPITVEGKLVDSKCYGMATGMGMPEAGINDDHMVPKPDGDGMMKVAKCGTACATLGIPVAVLEGGEAGGDVYVIIGPAGGFAEYMANDVKFEGEQAYPGAIIPSKFWVKEDGNWVEKALPGTMM